MKHQASNKAEMLVEAYGAARAGQMRVDSKAAKAALLEYIAELEGVIATVARAVIKEQSEVGA